MTERSPLTTLGAIVLAAGLSRRMGGENKLLKPLDGRPLISYVLELVSTLGLRQTIVVAGPDIVQVEPLFPPDIKLIVNERPSLGMGVSIATGARHLNPNLRGVYIVLGDMPFIERQDYERLSYVLPERDGKSICVPSHKGQKGHPVLFGREHFAALRQLAGDQGARELFTAPGASLFEAAECSAGILIDLDTPDAFREAEASLR